MQVNINLVAGVEPYRQLISQIKNGVMTREILPGEVLPSPRQLAMDLQLELSIVNKAYYELKRSLILTSKGLKKNIVHKNALENCQFDLNEWIKSKLIESVQLSRSKGAKYHEIKKVFDQIIHLESNLGV